jgi:hypothetical protein
VPPLIAPLFALCGAFAALGDAPVGWLVAIVAGALAPDVDLLLLLLSPASAVRLHRGPTHTLLGLVASGASAGAVTHLTGGPALAWSIGLALAGTAVHAAFDALSIQGLALWGRGAKKRVAYPVLVAADPILTVACALGVLGAVGFPGAARLVGATAVVLCLYLVGLRVVLARRAATAARQALSTPVEGVFPRPESPARWTIVTRTLEGIRAGVLDLGTRRLSMLDHAPEAEGSPAIASTLGQAVLERAVFPVAHEEPSRRGKSGGKVVRLRDLRFAFDWPAPPFGADVELDADGRPVRERAWL